MRRLFMGKRTGKVATRRVGSVKGSKRITAHKRFHENDELNEALCMPDKAATMKKKFSKEQKEHFIDSIVESMTKS